MAHFIGYVQGNRGSASRTGSSKSGMDASAQGWRIGGSVMCRVNPETGEDEVTFDLTGGSGGGRSERLGTWKRTKDGFEKIE